MGSNESKNESLWCWDLRGKELREITAENTNLVRGAFWFAGYFIGFKVNWEELHFVNDGTF